MKVLSRYKNVLLLLLAAGALAILAPGMINTAFAYRENYHVLETPYAPLEDDEFSLVVFGDTQTTTESDSLITYTENSMQWVVDNADDLNLEYVIQVGDIVNDVEDPFNQDKDAQWKRISPAMALMDQARLPQAIVPGNHDYLGYANSSRNLDKFYEYFPTSRYDYMNSLEGTMDGTMENTYHFFSFGGVDYMILAIGYKPLNTTLEWACDVIERNPDRQTIIVTHSYFEADGVRTKIGDRMWDNLVKKYENVFMLICGHTIPNDGYLRKLSYGDNGNEVHEILVNMQYFEEGGAGTVFVMHFRNDGTLEGYLYNPTYQKHLNDGFRIPISENLPDPMHGSPTAVQIDGSVSGGYEYLYGFYDDDLNWIEDVYEYENLVSTEAKLAPAGGGTGYAVYKVEAGANSVLTSLRVNIDATVFNTGNSGTGRDGARLYVSTDGENYVIAENLEAYGKYTGYSFDLGRRVFNQESVYVKVVITAADSDTGVHKIKFVTADHRVLDDTDAAGFRIYYDFATIADWDIAGWSQEALEVSDLVAYSNYLATGKQSNYAGAEGYILYRFATENKSFETLNINLKGRLIGDDMGYAVRIYLSLDNGISYELMAQEKVPVTTYSGSYDLSEKVKGESDVMLRLQFYGSSWTTVGMSTYEITGTYRYHLKYEYGGGQAGEPNPSSYVPDDEAVVLNDPAQRPHYDFLGWYSDSGFTNKVTSIPEDMNGGGTLYAKWEATEYGISYELDGGKLTGTENPGSYTYFESITLHNPTKTGYTFAGWYANGEFTGNRITSIEEGSSGELTLYAKWLRNYRVTYVLGGGSLEGAPETFTSEDAFEFGTPVREGYEFQGWYRDAGYKQEISGITAGTEAALIVYAKWKAETEPVTEYGITYNLDGGVNAASNPAKYTAGTAVTLAAPSRSGYIFEGWYGDAEYSGEKVERIEAGAEGEVVLYAKWRKEAETPPPEDGGCNGTGNGAGLALMMLALSGALVIKRKGSKV